MKIAYNLTLDDIINSSGGQLIISGDGTGPLVFNEIFTDSRGEFSKNSVFIAFKGKDFDGERFVARVFKSGAACAVVSWSFLENYDISDYSSKTIIAVDDAVDAYGKIAKMYLSKFNPDKKIALTGSCGKTTTKEMAYTILAAKYGAGAVLKNLYNFNNLIGVPKTIFGLNREHKFLILEIGTNVKGEIKKLAGLISPNVGVITNIGKSHLLEFKNLEGVLEEKISLASELEHGDSGDNPYLILNAGDELLNKQYKTIAGVNFLSYGIKTGIKQIPASAAAAVSERISAYRQTSGTGQSLKQTPASEEKDDVSSSDAAAASADLLCTGIEPQNAHTALTIEFNGESYNAKIKFKGRHLISDFLCALLIGYVCGVDIFFGIKALEDFSFLSGRMEIIGDESKEYIIINDAYNSNPDSLKAALNLLSDYYADKKKILVLGDMLELGSAAEAEHFNIGLEAGAIADYIFYKGEYFNSFKSGLIKSPFDMDRLILANDKDVFKEEFLKIDKKNAVILVKASRGIKLEEYINAVSRDIAH